MFSVRFRYDVVPSGQWRILEYLHADGIAVPSCKSRLSYLYDFRGTSHVRILERVAIIHPDRTVRFPFHWRFLPCGSLIVRVDTDPVVVDSLGIGPRHRRFVWSYSVVRYNTVVCRLLFDRMEGYVEAPIRQRFDIIGANEILLLIQEEAFQWISMTATDIETGKETTILAKTFFELLDIHQNKRLDDHEWEIELARLIVPYGKPDIRLEQDRYQWRFTLDGDEQWMSAPVISEVAATKLPSAFELHFIARNPYLSLDAIVDLLQCLPIHQGDIFDLGVWVSDTAYIDTEKKPTLTVPYSKEMSRYDLHVPSVESSHFIGVAPIRKFPHEEVGVLSVVFVP